MALLDLSRVTAALQALLRENLKRSALWNEETMPKVLPLPPDKLVEAGKAVGIYLYHAAEDPQRKNLPGPGQDVPSVRFVPMGLNLFYLLTAHAPESQDNDSPLEEQKMMGVAMKALHDYPVVDEKTRVNAVQVFPPPVSGGPNRIRISLLPVASNEAVSYWTAGSSPLRLAAYYEVSVVLLEPEESQTRPGRVLAYGVHTFAEGAPQLVSSSNAIKFRIPEEAEDREIELRPAQATYDEPVTFVGTAFTGGRLSLLLRSSYWDQPVEVDSAWQVMPNADKVTCVVRKTVAGRLVYPGVHAAILRVTRTRTMPDGSTREFEHLSNDCPFMVAPKIDSVEALGGDCLVINGQPSGGDGIKEIRAYVGNVALTRKPNDVEHPAGEIEQVVAGIGKGEFKVWVPKPPPESSPRLVLRLPSGLTPGAHQIRVIMNGAESSPRWISVP